MKIYIAGPMSGLAEFNRHAFHSAHIELTDQGHTVLSPAVLPDGLEQYEYMDICLAMLRCVDCIYMLKGWEDSLGAKAEHALADKLGLQIEYQRTMTAEHHCPSCGGIGWSATCDKCIPYQGAIMTTSPLKADSRSEFEAEFRKQYAFDKHLDLLLEMYNHGTDEEPEIDYYSLAARDAWKWWQASRAAIVVDLPSLKQSETGDRYQWSDGVSHFKHDTAGILHAAGITVKGDS